MTELQERSRKIKNRMKKLQDGRTSGKIQKDKASKR
jgi:hypothetical protein